MEGKAYNSVSEMMKDIHEDMKWWEHIYYPCCRFFDRIIAIPKRIKWFFQRGFRGYSDFDIWSLDFYLSNIISKSVKKLKETCNSVPTWKEDMKEEEAIKKWNNILDNIIYTFEINKKVMDSDIYLYESDIEKKKVIENIIEEINEKYPEDKIRMLNQDEQNKYEEGWKLFKEYFFYLWD